MESNLNKNWHSFGVNEIFELLSTGEKGISQEEAEKRIKRWGLNKIPEKNGERIINILLRQFSNPLIYILIIAGAVSLLLKDIVDSLIIFGAVVLNAAIGFFQELKVSNILRELRKLVSFSVRVSRGGKIKQIDSKEVTAGDIIILRQGDRIPADARIISATGFKTNESTLTGESMPVEKETFSLAEDTPVADRKNMVFMGTFAEEGVGRAVVTNTGINTELGKIAALIKEERKQDITPFQIELKKFAKTLGILFLSVAAALFLTGIITGQNILLMFLTSVAVAVAAVPESLPVALSVTLAIGAGHILSKGGLVRKMIAAEALGSTTVVATDKTATLTEGKMHVTKIITAQGKEIEKESFLDVIEKGNQTPEYLTFKLLTLLTNAVIENPSEPKENWRVHGRPIDKALILTVTESGLNKDSLEQEMTRVTELPFSPRWKYSATLNRLDEEENILSVLGAPEVLLSLSEKFHGDSMNKPLNQEKLNWASERIAALASEGSRVLAVGFKLMPSSLDKLAHSDIKDLTLLAIIALSDPIREEVKEAIETAASAGIKPIIITGDHLLTSNYVARELNILKGKRSIEGKDLPRNLSPIVNKYNVYARVTPEDKVKIVETFKQRGENVAMIGDGINDAPALLEADIGVAVGSGTDVAKAASDLVLINDSFSIIVEAIKQGRIILDNIKKAIIFLLSDAFSEIVLISGSILAGLPLALLPAQILWVNIIEDGLPAISLAFEHEEENVMKKRPEKDKKIFTREMKFLIATFAVVTDLVLFLLFFFCLKNTNNVVYARTMTFVGLGITSLFYIFSVRTLEKPFWKNSMFSNRVLNLGVASGFILYFAAIYLAPLNKILGIMPLRILDWSIIALLSFFNIAVIEIAKAVFLRKKH